MIEVVGRNGRKLFFAPQAITAVCDTGDGVAEVYLLGEPGGPFMVGTPAASVMRLIEVAKLVEP